MASLRSPWSPTARQPRERRDERRHVGVEALDELATRPAAPPCRRPPSRPGTGRRPGCPPPRSAAADARRRAASAARAADTTGPAPAVRSMAASRIRPGQRVRGGRTTLAARDPGWPGRWPGRAPGRSQAMSSVDRSGIRIATPSPSGSAAAPRYGASAGPAGHPAAATLASHPSRRSTSRVAAGDPVPCDATSASGRTAALPRPGGS